MYAPYQPQWYALRVTYGRELTAKQHLDDQAIDAFIPMRYEYVIRGKKKEKKLVPAISNLIFVRTSKLQIDILKRTTLPYLRYIIRRDEEQRFPLVVREEDMENFIRVARRVEEDIRYLSPDDYDLKKGERVRVIGGPFVGAVGILVKVKGARAKRVVVELEDMLHLAAAAIPVNWIEPIAP